MNRLQLLGLLLTALVPTPALGQARLGTIHFPTSGSAVAQPHFIEGVLYLHSFEYRSAAQAFRKAQETDAGFAMAYWGEAMTYNHPIWNERDRSGALAALARLASTREARRGKAPTEREKMYLDAVEVLYEDGPKPERDTAYAAAMERLVRAFPEDHEARLFYALSLQGLSQGVRSVPTYMRAAALAEEAFRDNPDHPGAAHYLIHSYDDPTHAPLGLRAARAYSRIAPDAPHAQHMTTHIFLAMGMWDEVVSQNRIAADLTDWGPGHYPSWHLYGLLQQGKHQVARAQLERAKDLPANRPSGQRLAYLIGMRAHYVINTERWDDPAISWTIDASGVGPVGQAIDAFVTGLAALNRGDRPASQRALERLRAVPAEGTAGVVPRILTSELAGAMAVREGQVERGLGLLLEAARLEDGMPVEFGPPDVVKPTHELLGEALLTLGRAQEAEREFRRALEMAPRRALSLRGLGRAAASSGNRAAAARAYELLREIWHSADGDVPGLDEARRFVASR
ncbi:MAG TPA: bacterial transcriptional activator domain-containing protein [Gemmatimonadales bacterium]|nr:bacterial transcriptional activator domain-containing protein [Gemmatimonadales bacterium]